MSECDEAKERRVNLRRDSISDVSKRDWLSQLTFLDLAWKYGSSCTWWLAKPVLPQVYNLTNHTLSIGSPSRSSIRMKPAQYSQGHGTARKRHCCFAFTEPLALKRNLGLLILN
jgi:hypothetical protein